MSDDTPRLKLGQMVDGQELDAMTINDALIGLDAFTDICLKGQFVNTPPSSPADGDTYLLGGAPTGAWSGYAYKLAYCIDGGWRFYTPFNGLRVFVAPTNAFLVYQGGTWIDANALISASEASIASAATCDLEAAASLFVAVTGTAAITSLGTGTNLLRLVRFAGSLTLTHNATSLILPGGASIVTAAGDSAIFASDGSGNWRCRGYSRANGVPLNVAAVTGTGNMVLSAAPTFTGTTAIGNGGASTFGNLALNGATTSLFGAYINFQRGGTDQGYIGNESAIIGNNSDDLVVYSKSALKFYSNTALAGQFGTDRSFLVGTTTNGGWTGDAKIAAQGGSINVLSSYTTATNGIGLQLRVDYTTAQLANFHYGTTAVGSITTNGTTTTYGTTSDARLKNRDVQQRDYRQAIRALWVGDFTWKETGAPGFGVLAQQAYEVMPGHAGVTRPDVQEEQWHASAEPFAFLALWGVKDLYALVETLAARVAALEAAHAPG